MYRVGQLVSHFVSFNPYVAGDTDDRDFDAGRDDDICKSLDSGDGRMGERSLESRDCLYG